MTEYGINDRFARKNSKRYWNGLNGQCNALEIYSDVSVCFSSFSPKFWIVSLTRYGWRVGVSVAGSAGSGKAGRPPTSSPDVTSLIPETTTDAPTLPWGQSHSDRG
jgi:hypothetical protein